MRVVEELEKPIVEAMKNLPSLPINAKEALVKYWPYLVLVFGVLQILGAFSSWQITESVLRLGYYPIDRTSVYIGIAMMLVEAVIFFMAYAPLKKHSKRGWDLLFLAGIINIVYAVVSLFMNGYGVGSFLMSLLLAAFGFYLLVQVRDYYVGKATIGAKGRASVKSTRHDETADKK